MKSYLLHRLLHARGENTTTLAAKICSSRTHVGQVLNNDPGRGGQTRRKLAPLLTPEELALAGWDQAGNLLSSVPHGTTSHPEIHIQTAPGDKGISQPHINP